jgi:hypothetical protein
MTLLQLTIRLSNSSEAIDTGNPDLQFSPVDQLGDFSQDRRPRRLSVSHGLDAILCRSRKASNRLDPFRSDAHLEGEFDVINTEGIDKGVEVIVRGATKTLLDAFTISDRDDTVVTQPLIMSWTGQADHQFLQQGEFELIAKAEVR